MFNGLIQTFLESSCKNGKQLLDGEMAHPSNKVECRHDCKCPLPSFPHFPVAQEMNRRQRHKTLCDDEGSDFFCLKRPWAKWVKEGEEIQICPFNASSGDRHRSFAERSGEFHGLRPFTWTNLRNTSVTNHQTYHSLLQTFVGEEP